MTIADRKTPETDAQEMCTHDASTYGEDWPAKVVQSSFARRLERERDAAVEALKLCYDHCRLWHPEIEINNVGETARATLRAIEESQK